MVFDNAGTSFTSSFTFAIFAVNERVGLNGVSIGSLSLSEAVAIGNNLVTSAVVSKCGLWFDFIKSNVGLI